MLFLRRFLTLLALMAPLALLQAADPVPWEKDDAAFAKKAAINGLIEVRSAEIALKRNLTPEEKEFAERLIADHKKANDDLTALARKRGATLPTTLGSDEQEKVAKMAEIKDKDFNEEFLEHQISCHKKAIDLFEDQAEDGKDPELKAFAAKYLPTLKAHLETAKRLEEKY